jgi:hypothetical protein
MRNILNQSRDIVVKIDTGQIARSVKPFMVGHQVEGMDTMTKPLDSFLEQHIKTGTIGSAEKDILPTVPTEDHMIDITIARPC